MHAGEKCTTNPHNESGIVIEAWLVIADVYRYLADHRDSVAARPEAAFATVREANAQEHS